MPVIVNVEVPEGVPELVNTVKMVEPDPVTVVGLKIALELPGTPVTVKETVPLNPPEEVIVTV